MPYNAKQKSFIHRRLSTAERQMCIYFSYKQARAAIDTIFGPKCHKEFPRLYRLSDDDCSGDGFYPSRLGGTYTEYEHKGIDLIIENGAEVNRSIYSSGSFKSVFVLTCRQLVYLIQTFEYFAHAKGSISVGNACVYLYILLCCNFICP